MMKSGQADKVEQNDENKGGDQIKSVSSITYEKGNILRHVD